MGLENSSEIYQLKSIHQLEKLQGSKIYLYFFYSKRWTFIWCSAAKRIMGGEGGKCSKKFTWKITIGGLKTKAIQ